MCVCVCVCVCVCPLLYVSLIHIHSVQCPLCSGNNACIKILLLLYTAVNTGRKSHHHKGFCCTRERESRQREREKRRDYLKSVQIVAPKRVSSLVSHPLWRLSVSRLWGGYGQQDRLNYRSLLQNFVSFIGLLCKRDLSFHRSYSPKPPQIIRGLLIVVMRVS